MCGSGALDACWTKDRGNRSMAPALTQATHQRQALSLHSLWQSTGKKKRQRPNLSEDNKVDEGGHCQQTALDPLRTPPQDAPAVASAPFSYPAQRNGFDGNVNSNVQCGGSNGKIMGLQQRTGADNLVGELDGPVIDDVVKGDQAPIIDDNVDDILQVFSSIASEVSAEQAVAAAELGLSAVEQQLLQEAAAVINLCPPQEDKETVALQRLQQAQARLHQLEQRCDLAFRRACRLTTRQSSQTVAGHVGSVERHLRESLSIRPARSTGVQNLYSWAEDGRLPTREEVRSIPTATLVSLVNKLQAPPTPQVNNRRYFGFGPSHSIPPSASGDSKLSTSVAEQLDSLSGTWTAQLRHLQRFDDPDATESSSGGESDEEGPVAETQAPPPAADAPENAEEPTRPISLYRRAIWRWYRERATIASKWTWLQAQIADLEYRIRQHTDLYRQLRASKRPIQLATPPAVIDQVSTATEAGECETASRTCGVRPCSRRRLIRASMLGTTWRSMRNGHVRCACVAADETCVLCAGKPVRQPPVNVDPDGMALKERISLVDRGFHPVLSMEKDILTGVHVDSLLKTGDWRNHSTNQTSAQHTVHVDHEDPAVAKRKHAIAKRKFKASEESESQGSKLDRRKLLLKKRKRVATCSDLMDEDSCSFPPHSPFSVTGGDGPSSGAAALLRSRERHSLQDIIRRRTSYDIDNIVIPASMIATSRVEKWEYKEIITPKWRLIEEMNADDTKENLEETEDISDDAFRARHDRSEADERRKFLSYLKPKVGTRGRQRRTERADSRAESSGANSPDPLSPHLERGVDVVGEPGNDEGTPAAAPRRLSLSNDKEEALLLRGIKERRSAVILTRNRETCRGFSEENSATAWDFDSFSQQFAVAPYEPRVFPIEDADYEQMLSEMPEEDVRPSRSNRARNRDDEDALSSQPASSATSADPEPDQEDPDDPEWEGVASKSRKR